MRLNLLILTIASMITAACGSDPAPVADLQWRINYGIGPMTTPKTITAGATMLPKSTREASPIRLLTEFMFT